MINIENLIKAIPKGNKTALETLKVIYPEEFREYECKQWFQKDILNKLVKKVDEKEYPNYVFYFIKDKWFFELKFDQDGKNDAFWVKYENCWEVFYNIFHYNYYETKRLIKGMVEKHFKMRCNTPHPYLHTLYQLRVEEHFKKLQQK